MKWVWLILLGFLIFFGQSQFTQAKPKTLSQLWKLEQKNPRPLTENIKNLLMDRHMVLVPGIMNGLGYWVSGYFQTINHVLETTFNTQSSYVGLWSSQSTDQNSDHLNEELRSIYQKVNKPLILLGHSKGGAEALLTLLKNPDLILDGIVDRAILIQAAIKGSPLLSSAILDEATFRQLFIKPAFFFLRGGLESLRPEVAQKFINDAYATFESKTNPEERDYISSRISYIRSYTSKENIGYGVFIVLMGFPKDIDFLSPKLSFFDKIATTFNLTRNDGLLRLADQLDERIGSEIGIVEADHMELVLGGWAISKGIWRRRAVETTEKEALLKAIFRKIYEPIEKIL